MAPLYKAKKSPRIGVLPSATLNSSLDYITIPAEDDESEASSLSPQVVYLNREAYSGTVLSSVINLSNTILGAGILAMPSAFASTGLGLGIILVCTCGFFSGLGLFLLTLVAEQVGRKSSFYASALLTYPKAALLIDSAIAIKCFGVSISYLVICKDLLPQVMAGFFPGLELGSLLLKYIITN